MSVFEVQCSQAFSVVCEMALGLASPQHGGEVPTSEPQWGQ